MYIEQLVYITEVYKLGKITDAAEKCYVSPSGISQSINSLEKELGINIFERSRTGVKPTIEGKRILKVAFEMVSGYNKLHEITSQENNKLNTRIKISASPSLFFLLLQSAQGFKNQYPNVSIDIIENSAPEVVESVKRGNSDIGMTAINHQILKKNSENIQYKTFLKVKRSVCVSKESSLNVYSSLGAEDIINETFALYNGMNFKLFIEKFFEGKNLDILFQTNQIEIIKKAVVNNLAITILNKLILNNDPYVIEGDIVQIPLEEAHNDDIDFGVIQLKGNDMSGIAREFLNYVEDRIAQNNY